MKSKLHPDPDTLHMYLDAELSAEECEQLEVHLETCDACRAELEALQGLFSALDEIALDFALVPDLAPGVLARIQLRRKSGLRWLVPALQGVVALVLLAWSWTWLSGYVSAVAHALPAGLLEINWGGAIDRLAGQWDALVAWFGTMQVELQNLSFRFSSGPTLAVPQLLVLGIAVAVLWLAGNGLLLRRTLLNGKYVRRR